FFLSTRGRHTSFARDWSSDVCSSDLHAVLQRAMFEVDADARLGFPIVGLSELYVDPAVAHLQSHGAELHFGAPVRALALEGEARSEERGVGVGGRCRGGLEASVVIEV